MISGLNLIPFSYQSGHGCQQCESAVNPEPCCLGLCWEQERLLSAAGKLHLGLCYADGHMIENCYH